MSEPHLHRPDRLAGVVLPLGLISISSASVLIKLCDAPPLTIAAYRLGLAVLLLLPFTFSQTRSEVRRLGRGDILSAIVSGIFLSAHFAFWVSSLKHTSVASSVVFVTTNPIFIVLVSTVFLRERFSAALFASILTAVCGGLVIAWDDWSGQIGNLYGDFLALLGAVMASGYLLAGRRIRPVMGLAAYITIVYGIAAVLLIGMARINGDPFFVYSGKTYLLFILLALVPQLIGHTALNWALKFFTATWVSVLILSEPIGAAVLAGLILAEYPTAKVLAGGALVLLGIYLAAREEKKTLPQRSQCGRAATKR